MMHGLVLAVLISAAPEFAILSPGAHHGREVKAPGQGWLGLFPEKLAPVTMKTQKVHDPIDDDGKPESVKSGIEISVEGEAQPVVMLKGLKAREVMPIALPPGGPLEIGKAITLGEASLSAVDAHQIVLIQGDLKQVLYQQKDGDTDGWKLTWAGDLDGDGKLDLILEAAHHYSLTTVRLFLSSRAKKGQLVSEVAKFSTSSC